MSSSESSFKMIEDSLFCNSLFQVVCNSFLEATSCSGAASSGGAASLGRAASFALWLGVVLVS